MTEPSPPVVIEMVGGTVPSDALIEWLCDWAIDLLDQQEAEDDQDGL